MPRPTSETARAWAQGYGRRSVAALMSNAERKAWRAWMKERGNDSAAFEAQLSHRQHRRRNPYAEV